MFKLGQVGSAGPPPRSLQPAVPSHVSARVHRRVVAQALHSHGKRGRRELLGGLVRACLANTPNATANAAAYVVEQETVRVEALNEPAQPSTSGRELDNPPTYVTATGRIVAIGDLHGDWNKAIASLILAGVVEVVEDEHIIWTGGDTVVVQLGDVLDRGDHEIAIIQLLRALDAEARQHGGAVYMLNGNHESLNICGDFRYVTPGAFMESAEFVGVAGERLTDWELLARARFAVFRPGGPMAMELSKNPTVLVVNDTVFAHGGLLPKHVAYGLDKLNGEVAAWMRADIIPGGRAAPPFMAMGDANSVMWNRTLSRERFPSQHDQYTACNALKQALDSIGAKRLVVGHTPQLGGANCECGGKVWRIDVGMSYGVLNRPVQVLEISPNPLGGEAQVRVVTQASPNSLVPVEEQFMFDL